MKGACQVESGAAVWSHYPPFIKGMASPRHMFRLGEPALTLRNLFAFCFVNRLLLLSWKAGDAICSPSPKAGVTTEGGIVSKTPGFCVYEGLGSPRTFSSLSFWNPRSLMSDMCLLMGKIVLILHPLQCWHRNLSPHGALWDSNHTTAGKAPYSSINITQQDWAKTFASFSVITLLGSIPRVCSPFITQSYCLTDWSRLEVAASSWSLFVHLQAFIEEQVKMEAFRGRRARRYGLRQRLQVNAVSVAFVPP